MCITYCVRPPNRVLHAISIGPAGPLCGRPRITRVVCADSDSPNTPCTGVPDFVVFYLGKWPESHVQAALRSSSSFFGASFLGARRKDIFLYIKKKEKKSRRHVVTSFDLRFLFVRCVILYAAANDEGKPVILFAFLPSRVKSFIALMALFSNVFGI